MAMAWAAASSGSGASAAENAAMTAVSVQPVAVISCIVGWPFDTLMTRCPFVTCRHCTQLWAQGLAMLRTARGSGAELNSIRACCRAAQRQQDKPGSAAKSSITCSAAAEPPAWVRMRQDAAPRLTCVVHSHATALLPCLPSPGHRQPFGRQTGSTASMPAGKSEVPPRRKTFYAFIIASPPGR